MEISMIVAMDENRAIGKDGKLLWHIPKDLKWMKDNTMGHPIVMGRHSYEDIICYSKGKPLPGRTNVVLSKTSPAQFMPGFMVLPTIEEVLSHFSREEKIFILGGAQVYKAFLPLADELIITHVHATYEADTFFPEFDQTIFLKTFEQTDSQNGIEFSFCKYRKQA